MSVFLLRRVGAIETERLNRDTGHVALVWSDHVNTVDPDGLQPGESIAVDVRVIPGDPEEAAAILLAAAAGAKHDVAVATWQITERVTTDPQDLGDVYLESGARIGRVTGVDGALVDIRYEAALLGGSGGPAQLGD